MQKGISMEKTKIDVDGMHCASCAMNIEKALKKTRGIMNVSVNFPAEKAFVEFDPTVLDYDQITQVIRDTGYEVRSEPQTLSLEKEDEEDLSEMRAARSRMLLAWVFTVPVMAWMSLEMFFGIAWLGEPLYTVIMLALAASVVFFIGWPTQRSALKSITHRQANMDVLIMLGTTVSFITGIVSLFTEIRSFAAISAMIMAIHLTGRTIESAARGRASQAIRKLLQLGAKTARVLRNGTEQDVPIEEVRVGDVMIVRPGEKVPTDGIVVEGYSALDESMVTGESMPVNRGPHSPVIGATVNQEGLLKVRATKIGKDTFLAHIIRLVEEAQGSKVPIQEFADRVTAVFVPVVLGTAVLTFLFWLLAPGLFTPVTRWAASLLPWVNPDLGGVTLAFFAAVAVLVIACPCALGLATPTALMVGTGMGARKGVLIRKGEAIQTLKDVGIVVFDKTGTLTRGTPEVTDMVPAPGVEEDLLLTLAASVESGSEHPIGKAVVKRARDKGLTLSDAKALRALRGRGIEAEVQGSRVIIGSRVLMQDSGIDITLLDFEIEGLEAEGKTAVIAAADGRLLGCIAVADTLKEDAVQAVQELGRLGIETAMLTGDNRRTAEAIARSAGITRVLAEVLPEGKVRELKNLQSTGKVVAMVGDGINDAPALTQADVGIAIGSGTDIAIEASDITLVRSDLGGVITAVKLSRATFRKIRQNLFWAYFYNTIAIPAAILGLLHPVIAEAAMAMSSINVVTNANLLRFAKVGPGYEQQGANRA